MSRRVCIIDDCDRTSKCRGMCGMHHQRAARAGLELLPKVTDAQRFWAKVNKTETCWLWIGARTDVGYGTIGMGGKLNRITVLAHRWSYEHHVGPIPAGLHIDHLCRNRVCVNPAHLEPVTNRVNVLRGMSHGAVVNRTNLCKRGHEFTPENTYIRPDGHGKVCRECHRIRRRAAYAAKKEIAA